MSKRTRIVPVFVTDPEVREIGVITVPSSAPATEWIAVRPDDGALEEHLRLACAALDGEADNVDDPGVRWYYQRAADNIRTRFHLYGDDDD